MNELVAFLREAGAHHDVLVWAEASAATLDEAFERCPRGDWLLGIAARLGVPGDVLASAAAGCARLALEDLDLERAHAIVDELEASIASAAPTDTTDALRAEAESEAKAAPDVAVASAWLTVAAACRARTDPSASSVAASLAVEVAVASVGDCAMIPAVLDMQRRTARVVRERVPVPRLHRSS